MRALAAVVTLAVWSCRVLAHDHVTHALFAALGVEDNKPVHRLLACGRALGPAKCLSALSAWRAENAVEYLGMHRQPQFNVTADVERFPWERYTNSSDEQLYTQLCDGAEKLLRYRTLSMDVPGYSLQLESREDDKLTVNVLKDSETGSARGSMKKYEKKFYNILPFLMIPGLIMSAILPFVLPALKLMTVAVVMLNNMALSGAVFTLLRNNAFNDHYEKKIIYTNEGYNNEKHSPVYFKEVEVPDVPLEHVDGHYSGTNVHGVVESPAGVTGGDFRVVEEYPTNEDWINQYYGNDRVNGKVRRSSQRGNRFKKRM